MRKIPKVAFVSLVAGTGCDSGSIVDRAVQAICRVEKECDPVSFDYAYTSLRDCEQSMGATLDYYYAYYARYYGRACAHALFDFYRCYYESIDARRCSDLNVELDCFDELYAYYDACG